MSSLKLSIALNRSALHCFTMAANACRKQSKWSVSVQGDHEKKAETDREWSSICCVTPAPPLRSMISTCRRKLKQWGGRRVAVCWSVAPEYAHESLQKKPHRQWTCDMPKVCTKLASLTTNIRHTTLSKRSWCGMAMWQAGLCWPSLCLSCHLRRSQKTHESFQTSPLQHHKLNNSYQTKLSSLDSEQGQRIIYFVVTSQSQMQVSKEVKWKAGERRLGPMWNITLEAKFSDAMKSDQKRHSPLPALHVSARKGWKHPTLKWTTQPITELWPCITNQAESVGKSSKK